MAQGQVNWYDYDVLLAIDGASDEFLTKLAFQGEGYAKVNVQTNEQIDTGFMINSIYGMGPDGDHRAKAESEAHAAADRPMAPEIELEEHQAAIHAAAEYAAYQEMRRSFLYRAVEQLRRDAYGIIHEVARRRL